MKKIIALILSMAMVLSLFSISFVSAKAEGSDYVELLSILGCIDSSSEEILKKETVTRGEFAKIIADILNFENAGESTFEDVPEGSSYAKEINAAASFKVMMGDGEGNFNPEREVTELEAMITVLRVLGYEEYAYYRGGYPTGYYQAARATKLLSGLGEITKENITGSKLSILLKNMLDEPVYEVTSVEGDYASKGLSDKTFLSIYYGIGKAEGVMTANRGTTLIEAKESGGITVGDTFISTEDKRWENYIGYSCEAYYDEETEVLFWLCESEKNKTEIIASEDIINVIGQNITYEISENKEKELTIPSDAYIIYNGRALKTYKESLFKPVSGELRLIDNNSDGRIDVVSVLSYETVVVHNVNSVDENITLKFNAGIITSDDLKDVEFFDKNGKTDMTWINAWDVLDILRDGNGNIISIYAAGEIERKTPANISIGEESYIEFTDGTVANIHKTAYNRMSAARPGETMAFSFDMFGNIVACIDDNLKTLAVIAAVPKRDGDRFEPTLMIKYFTQSGEMLTAEFKSVIRFNKEPVNLTKASELNEFWDTLYAKRGSIAEIEVDSSGKIATLNLMENMLDDEANHMSYYGNASTNAVIKDGDMHFINTGAVAFYVPYNLVSPSKDSQGNEVVNWSDDDFEVIKATSLGQRSDIIDIYKRMGSESTEAEAVRILKQTVAGVGNIVKYNQSVDAYTSLMLISGKSKVYNEDEGIVYTRLSYWYNGGERSALIENEEDIIGIDEGDIVWIDTMDGNKISRIIPIFDYSEKKCVHTGFALPRTSPTAGRGMTYGKIAEAHDNFYTLDQESMIGHTNETPVNYLSHRYPSYGYIFDETKTNKVRKASNSDFTPDGESEILVYSSYWYQYMAVIYKK